MSQQSVFAHVFSLHPRAARAELMERWGEQLSRWIAVSEVSVTDVAAALGQSRPSLYKLWGDSQKPFRAELLYLLPPALLRLVLEDLAASIGYQLAPVVEAPADYDHGQAHADYVRELTDLLRARAEHEADGHLSPQEAACELREIEQAERELACRKALLHLALRERGGVITVLVERLRGQR